VLLREAPTPPWRACLEEAGAAYRAGSLPIGAAVADPAGSVIARGRNRIHEHEADGGHLHGHRLAHAELNALNALDYRASDPLHCTRYTTTEPCPRCTGAIRIVKIGTVRYAARATVGGTIALLEATPFMRRGGSRVHPVGRWAKSSAMAACAKRLARCYLAVGALLAQCVEFVDGHVIVEDGSIHGLAVQNGKRRAARRLMDQLNALVQAFRHPVGDMEAKELL